MAFVIVMFRWVFFELTQNRTICFLKQMKSIHYRLQFSNSSEECVWSPPKNFSKR